MEKQTSARVITLRDLWDIFVKRLPLMVLAAVIGAVGMLAAWRVTYRPVYESTATLYILRQSDGSSSGEASTDFSLALKVVNDCTYMLKSHSVLDAVQQELSLDIGYDALYEMVSTSNPEDTRILCVTVKAESPELAKSIVDQICLLGSQKINEAMGFAQVNLYEYGILETKPANTMNLMVVLAAGVVSAVLVYGLFLIIYLLDDTLRSNEDVERQLHISVLAEIPAADSTNRKPYGRRPAVQKKSGSDKKGGR